MDWGTLTGSKNTAGAIARWLNSSQLSSGAGGDADLILQEAQGWIYTRLRHFKMLATPQSATMVVGDDFAALPADLLEPDYIAYSGIVNGNVYSNEIPQLPINDIYRKWQYDGSGARVPQQPMFYSFNGTQFQFDSPADVAYPYSYTYYQSPALLSAGNATNFLTTFYPRLIRCACMMMGAEWVKEAGQGQFDRTYWLQQATDELNEAQAQSDRARRAIRGGMVEDRPARGAFW